MTTWFTRWLTALVLLLSPVTLAATELAAEFGESHSSQAARSDEAKEPSSADVKLLNDAGMQTDGGSLVSFFRRETLRDEQRREITELIRQLGNDDFNVREQASKKLIALKAAAVPALRQALNHRDAEVASRAKKCINALGNLPPVDLRAAAARVLVIRKPLEAVEVLLAFLPDAADRTEEDWIVAALTALGVRDGKVDTALVAALTDKLPLRRAIAGEVLAAVGGVTHRGAVRKLLSDTHKRVRLHIAVALTYVGDKDAVPVLIDVTADLPWEQTREAQELLLLLAGAKAPRNASVGDAPARIKYRDDWNTWWKEHGIAVDLARVQAGPPSKAKVAARASASRSDTGTTPDQAFAFEAPKGWHAGGYAPQWIEADLGARTRLASLAMNPCQLPVVCDTTHEIWVSDKPIGEDRTKAKLVHTFKGQTENGHSLVFEFPKGVSARCVQILTTASASWVAWDRIEVRVGRTRSAFVSVEGR